MRFFTLRRGARENRKLFRSGTFDGRDAGYFERGFCVAARRRLGKWVRSLDTPDRGEHAARVISEANPAWSAMLRDTIRRRCLSADVRANVIPPKRVRL